MPDPHFYPQPQPLTLKEIASLSGAELRHAEDTDQADLTITNVAPLQTATPSDISFLDNKKYIEFFTASKAGACFVAPEHVEKAPKGMALLVSPTPYKAYALTAQKLYPEPVWTETSIASSATVHPTAKIGPACRIEPNVVIGENVTIGAKCWIKANTTIDSGVTIGENVFVGANVSLAYCKIGDGVRILPGVRIGQDGFGFAIDPAGHVPVPQLGRVLVGNRVWIGANATIDRGAGPDTIIGDGCMIDNLVQIGHNVKIGKHVVIVAQVGVSGSVEIEDYAVLAGQVGVAGHLRIGRGARIAAQSGLMKDVPAGAEMMGSPAVPLKDYFRQVATLSQLVKKERG